MEHPVPVSSDQQTDRQAYLKADRQRSRFGKQSNNFSCKTNYFI